jgi:hypothetical protein
VGILDKIFGKKPSAPERHWNLSPDARVIYEMGLRTSLRELLAKYTGSSAYRLGKLSSYIPYAGKLDSSAKMTDGTIIQPSAAELVYLELHENRHNNSEYDVYVGLRAGDEAVVLRLMNMVAETNAKMWADAPVDTWIRELEALRDYQIHKIPDFVWKRPTTSGNS